MAFERNVVYLSKKQLGLSLVELMVAILIGLVILAGVLQVMVTSKRAFLDQEEVSFIQENARYALDVIGKDIRESGYFGCAGFNKSISFVPDIAEPRATNMLGVEPLFSVAPDNFNGVIRPVVQGDDDTRPFPFFIRGISDNPIALEVDQAGTAFQLVKDAQMKLGELIAIVGEDCRSVAVVKVSDVNDDGDLLNFNGGICEDEETQRQYQVRLGFDEKVVCGFDCDCSGTAGAQANIKRYFGRGSVVSKYKTSGYYIGNSGVLPDQPALIRRVYRGSNDGGEVVDEEVALGVEDMQILYGVQTADNVQYLAAEDMDDAFWNEVVSVEVSFIFRSQAEVLEEDQTVELLDREFNDRFMRRLISSTFHLRNKG